MVPFSFAVKAALQGALPAAQPWARAACGRHQVSVVLAEGDAAAGADDDDPRPRRWNHAVVVLIAVMLVGGVLGYGIADGCMCGPPCCGVPMHSLPCHSGGQDRRLRGQLGHCRMHHASLTPLLVSSDRMSVSSVAGHAP